MEPDQTIEILMTELDPEIMETFTKKRCRNGREATKVISRYSRVWNKRTPLNKRSPLENLAKRIIVAPFLPYTMKSGIRP